MYSQKTQVKDSQSNFSESLPPLQERLLSPFQQKLLQEKLQTNLRPEYRRRIEIMLLADRGHSQTQICATLNCSQETARYWMYIAQSGEAHKWKELPIGRPKTVNEQYLNCLRDLVSQSPKQYGYAFQRWTAHWLSKHLAKELGIEVTERHVNRLLKQMGLSTRPDSALENNKQGSKEIEPTYRSNIVIGNLKGNENNKSLGIKFSPFHLI
ncbi:hypothetical protein NIES4102_07810 [Chondrocystis sp. NIES-4102]|nr:hypothetical protein NIES4102_07810 [Chondrocystis sp. NIES-4102]